MLERPHDTPIPFKVEEPRLLIEHSVDGAVVPQRPTDGYVNATLLCQQAGKRVNDYLRLEQTKDFLKELSAVAGIPATALVQVRQGGNDRLNQGTWVHPQVAINLGQWLSPTFAVQVTKWVFDWMQGKTQPYMPVHVQRFLKNRSKIPHTHFSMLNEIYLSLFATLEDYGVIPPDNIMPDISTGRMFSGFLRQKGIDPEQFPTYQHEFADETRTPVQARLYPIEHLPEFRRYFNEVWLPTRAEAYFRERFPRALPHLTDISALPSAS